MLVARLYTRYTVDTPDEGAALQDLASMASIRCLVRHLVDSYGSEPFGELFSRYTEYLSGEHWQKEHTVK